MATPSRPEMPALEGGGWIAFAGVMLILAGAIDFFDGIWALRAGNVFEASYTAPVWNNLDAWGVIYILLGIGLIVTGFFIFQREPWAVTVGIVVSTVGAILHAFWLFSQPFASMVLIGINLLVLYGLVVYGSNERTREYA
jgi:hypothetical protein